MERLFTKTDRLKQTLFVIHLWNRKKRLSKKQKKSTNQTNSFHYDHIFNDIYSHLQHVRQANLFLKYPTAYFTDSNSGTSKYKLGGENQWRNKKNINTQTTGKNLVSVFPLCSFNRRIVIRSHSDANSSFHSFTSFNKPTPSARWAIFCVFASTCIDIV